MAASHVTAADERGPAVTLNHFYVVVDAPTYEAARTSPFLTREFAPFEARTTVRNDKSYTGIYWYGRRTYFELFEPGEQGPAGASGLALGVEEPEASALVKQRWEDALGSGRRRPRDAQDRDGRGPLVRDDLRPRDPGPACVADGVPPRLPGPLVRRAHAGALDHPRRRPRPLRREDRAVRPARVGAAQGRRRPDDRPRPGRARDAREAAARSGLDRARTRRTPSSAVARSRSGCASSHRRADARASSRSSSRCSTQSRKPPTRSAAPSCGSKASLPGCS